MALPRSLAIALFMATMAGCASDPCGRHSWFSWLHGNRNNVCCEMPCCPTTEVLSPSAPCGGCNGCGTVVGSSPVFAPSFSAGTLPPTAVPVPAGAVAPPAAVPQQPMARPMPYVPNGK